MLQVIKVLIERHYQMLGNNADTIIILYKQRQNDQTSCPFLFAAGEWHNLLCSLFWDNTGDVGGLEENHMLYLGLS